MTGSSAAQRSAMSSARRGVLHPFLLVLLVAGILLTGRLGGELQLAEQPHASAAPATTPEMRIEFGRNRLEISVVTTSPQHKSALQKLLADQFADSHLETDFRRGLILPAEWETITTRLLYVVATTDSATVIAGEDSIVIHASAQNLSEYESRLAFLQEAIGTAIPLSSEIISTSSGATIEELCARNFVTITGQTDGNRLALRFRQSSTVLGESAQALLDRLAEFAYDCEASRIAILGFTDSTGTESWNVQVSETRARAVAAQLISRGVAEERLLVEGRGSQSPLADNGTVQGRAQNRRIEFELR